jgi:hypothetical protein
MAARAVIAAASLAALGLAACNKAGTTATAGICKPFTTASTTATNTTPPTALNSTGAPVAVATGDPVAGLDDCLHRWGYTLATSSDPANLVADATLAACSDALAGWNQSSLTSTGGEQAPSLMTGQPTTPIAEHHSFAEGRALFYVVQARAGHCAAPPASTTTRP